MKHLIVLSALFLNLTYSQVNISWFSSYINNSTGHESYKTYTDTKGNSYFAGRTITSSSGGYFAAKFNDLGEFQWINTYEADGKFGIATDITTDNLGNVYITGESLESGNDWDAVTIKYNSAGVQQWITQFNSGGGELGFAITLDPTNSWVYVAGLRSNAPSFGDSADGLVLKLNALTGAVSWNSRIRLAQHNDLRYIRTDAAGNVYVSGVSGPLDNQDILTAKLNSSGTVLWSKRYNGTGNSGDKARGMEVTADGEVYVTGTSKGTGFLFDYITLNFNSRGNMKWSARFNGIDNLNDEPYDITVDNEKNAYVTGFTTSAGGKTYAHTIKYNSTGAEVWHQTFIPFDPHSFSSASSIATDDSGNTYICGNTGFSSDPDILVMKYDTSGAEVWRFTNDRSFNDEPKNISVNNKNGSILIGGNITLGTTGIFAMKLELNSFDNASSKQGQLGVPSSYRLYQNYPNPFNPSTKIVFDLPVGQFVKLAIYDAAGKTISTLVNSALNAGTHEITVSQDIIPASGVYFYKLESGSFSDIKKMVLIK